MVSHLPKRRKVNLLPIALVFESSLGFIGLLFGWLLAVPFKTLLNERHGNAVAFCQSLGVGALAALPMFALLLLIYFRPVGPLRKLSEDVKKQVAPLFHGLSTPAIALISLVAGIGEELLCRWCIQGALQNWLPGPLNWIWALLIASAIFGIGHWLNAHYAAYAFFAGLYLGSLWIWTGDLVVPITVHALYDYWALVLLTYHTVPPNGGDDSMSPPAVNADLD